MANKITNTQYYQNIADAIRTKNGESTLYTPPQMAQAILDIPTGSDKKFRFPFYFFSYGGNTNQGTGYMQKSFDLVSPTLKEYLGLKKVRLKGRVTINSNNAQRTGQGQLFLRPYAGNTQQTDITLANISCTGNSSTSSQIDYEYTLPDNVDRVVMGIYCRSSYTSASYPIDQNISFRVGDQAFTLDDVTWNNMMIEFTF